MRKLALERFLPYRLNRISAAMSLRFRQVYGPHHDLTVPEWRVLATLGQFETMSAKAIGAHSAMHKTKVSRAVAALQQRHWLTRASDEADRRIEHLRLTNAGLAAYREMVPLAKAFETKLLATLPNADREAVMRLITLLAVASRNIPR